MQHKSIYRYKATRKCNCKNSFNRCNCFYNFCGLVQHTSIESYRKRKCNNIYVCKYVTNISLLCGDWINAFCLILLLILNSDFGFYCNYWGHFNWRHNVAVRLPSLHYPNYWSIKVTPAALNFGAKLKFCSPDGSELMYTLLNWFNSQFCFITKRTMWSWRQ